MPLNLKVDIDPRSGFCFGVVNAIRRAESILEEDGHLYCLGQIVHNEAEVNRLKEQGMETLSHGDINGLKRRKILIRAHGEPPETYETLERNGNEIIDATCPIVLRLQERIRRSVAAGEFVLIFGKADHPEVIGLMGHIEGKGLVFKDLDEIELSSLPDEVTLYSQTTMQEDKLYEARTRLEAAGIRVTLKDTVCRQVSGRKGEMREFSRRHNAIIFVSGVESSNGKVLYESCREVNPRSYKISDVGEIDPSWFAPGESVGICGATSTPSWLMEKAREHLLTL